MAMLFTLWLLMLLLPIYVLAQTNGSVAVGASLSAAGNSSWISPSGDFAFGFRQLENNGLFLLSIWFAKIPDKTIVWYANGDTPAPQGSTVNLTANSGLVLTSPQGEKLWTSNDTNIIAGVVAHGVMNDAGNFVLENAKSAKLWETFKNPSDTMLPGQIMERGGKLVRLFGLINVNLRNKQLATLDAEQAIGLVINISIRIPSLLRELT